MFSEEHAIFICMVYFRTGTKNPHNVWEYFLEETYRQFQETYPEQNFPLPLFKQHCLRLVDRYFTTGTVKKGKSSGRPSIITQNLVEDVRERIKKCPKKSVRKLFFQTG